MTGRALVVDASTLVALLIDAGPDGRWSETTLAGAALAAPAVGAFEVANVVRRAEAAGRISASFALAAHQTLRGLPVEWWPYAPLAGRAWELRSNVSLYDASYVALAEITGHPLVTLDRRLSRAPGLRCDVLTP